MVSSRRMQKWKRNGNILHRGYSGILVGSIGPFPTYQYEEEVWYRGV